MSLNETFEIVDLVPTQIYDEPYPLVVDNSVKDLNMVVDDDFSNARANLYTLLAQGKDALITALDVARQSEHPRAFEVVGQLIAQISAVNHQLLDIHKKRLDLKKEVPEREATTKNVTNNSIFCGSTAELSKMLANMKKE